MLPALAVTDTLAQTADSSVHTSGGWVLLPVIYYTPETKLAGGAFAMRLFAPESSATSRRTSALPFSVIYTQRKQIFVDLQPDIYWHGATDHLSGAVGFSRFPDKFYGVGNSTTPDDEEHFSADSWYLTVMYRHEVLPSWFAGVTFDFRHARITEVEPDRLLSHGVLPGSGGGLLSGLGVSLSWDLRDNAYAPSSGRFFSVAATTYGRLLGSDYQYTNYNIDLREYFSPGEGHVTGVQVYMNFIAGVAPFQVLSRLGGESLMRGYYGGRFRDNDFVMVQAEHRVALWGRFGAAVFAAAGDVAGRLSRFSARTVKTACGFGFRYAFNEEEKINIRLDLGFCREEFPGPVITIGEAF